MTEQVTALAPSRRASVARIGLVGLAAAALVAAATLAIGVLARPDGTLAATGGAPNGNGPTLASGQGPGKGDHDGMRGGFGGGITITAIDGSSISLRTVDGWTRTITIASDTVLQKAGATIKLADLKVGDEVRFRQTRQTSGSYKIDELDVVLPHVDGTVTAVSSSSITVTRRDGSSTTIKVTSSTTYRVGGATGALSGIKVGMHVDAEGTKASDGTLTASAVRAFDASTFPARDGMGRHGGHDHGWGPDASAAPSSTGTTNG